MTKAELQKRYEQAYRDLVKASNAEHEARVKLAQARAAFLEAKGKVA